MPKEDKEYGLNFKCSHCGVAGRLNFATWMVRLTGGLEIKCPRCGKISVFVGKFGQDIYLERAIDDVKDAVQDAIGGGGDGS